ncbi:hypothetical protein EJ07DRAFT_156883 [Lizonia empirigonia]|nr:hypothetical protein EJ07DRAFT_156883 [Lizonia empirigonia]
MVIIGTSRASSSPDEERGRDEMQAPRVRDKGDNRDFAQPGILSRRDTEAYFGSIVYRELRQPDFIHPHREPKLNPRRSAQRIPTTMIYGLLQRNFRCTTDAMVAQSYPMLCITCNIIVAITCLIGMLGLPTWVAFTLSITTIVGLAAAVAVLFQRSAAEPFNKPVNIGHTGREIHAPRHEKTSFPRHSKSIESNESSYGSEIPQSEQIRVRTNKSSGDPVFSGWLSSAQKRRATSIQNRSRS